jgi:hypothetical protein
MAHALRSPNLLPGEREVLANEMLLQQHQFRQNMAMLHGLPMPEGPLKVERRDLPPGNGEPVAEDRLAEAAERAADAVADAVNAPPDTSTAEAIDRATEAFMDHELGNRYGATPGSSGDGQKGGTWGLIKKGALIAALLAGGASMPFIGGIGARLLDRDPAPSQQVGNQQGTTTTTEESNLLVELAKHGYHVAPTDLGEDIKKAFELNPELREQLLRDVKKTLEANGVEPRTVPPTTP